MNSAATIRSNVLEEVAKAEALFRARAAGQTVEGLGEITPQAAALLARELKRAHDWAISPSGQAEEADELLGDDDYVSHDPVISLVQAAIDEHEDDKKEKHAGKSLPQIIADLLGIRTRNQVPFIPPPSNDAFTFDLPDTCRVVLVGDWGTAKDRARRVARAIAQTRPDHIIHLGDVYPSGTRTRVRKRFLDVWKEEVGDGPRYWAMNGNHEMNAGGEGYFGVVLPEWKQAASFFCLRNEHWKLIALDTAYQEHDLEGTQLPWLMHQLGEGAGNNIVLSHHQPFSVVDTRPHENRNKLFTHVEPAVGTGRIFGWFCGHEHRCLSYARTPEWGNYHLRVIGHGGKRIRIVEDDDIRPELGPPLLRRWNVPRPDKPGRGMNGFALLQFDGAELTIEYVDETGRRWDAEIWPHTPHA